MKRYLLLITAAVAAAPYNHEQHANDSQSATHKQVMNWYGGPAYLGPPNLKVTAALVKAGGGGEDFSFAQALVSMLGEKTVKAEVAKLQKQYGNKAVAGFISGMDYAMKDGLKRATEAGIKLPPRAAAGA